MMLKMFNKNVPKNRLDSGFENSTPVSMDLKLRNAFEALYGRAPKEGETEVLNHVAIGSGNKPIASLYRAIIAAFDRQTLATPFTIRFGGDDVIYCTLNGFELATDEVDISVGAPMRVYQQYEPHMTSFFKSYIKPGMTVVDVGANIGYYSLLASQLVGAAGKVFSFEPNSENCRLILLSLRKNQCSNVHLHPIGVSDSLGVAYFSPHIGSNGGFFPSDDQTLMNPNCVVIPTIRLDDAIGGSKVDFLKMDTEGAEGLVIAGARKTIERDRPIVTSEFSMEMLPRVSGISCEEFLDFFLSLGYSMYVISQTTGEPQFVENPQVFLAGYGPEIRIEDLAFFPERL
jgi:FkbM family methyltransferase